MFRVKSIKGRIVDLAMGPDHTVCITEDGKMVRRASLRIYIAVIVYSFRKISN